jgi:hypothetical protein
MTELLHDDGSGEIWLELPTGVITLTFAADESHASVVRRTRAALAQASYPMHDPTSESSVAPAPDSVHAQ